MLQCSNFKGGAAHMNASMAPGLRLALFGHGQVRDDVRCASSVVARDRTAPACLRFPVPRRPGALSADCGGLEKRAEWSGATFPLENTEQRGDPMFHRPMDVTI